MKLQQNIRPYSLFLILFLSIFLVGCAGKTLVKKRELTVQNLMSSSIFLTPRPTEERIVYLEVRNSSDKAIYLKERVESKIRSAGYRITGNPDEANYIMQANILQAGKTDLRANSSMLENGFGGALLGAGAASLVSSSSNDVKNAAIIAAGIGLAMDAMIEDVNYTIITDVQVRERVAKGETVSQSYTSNLNQGTSSSIAQTSSNQSEWKTYQTRIISTANQVNLDFNDAIGPLSEGLANSIGGIF